MERILGSKMHIISLQAHCMSRGNEITTIHPNELYLERPENVSDDVEYPPIINTIIVTITSLMFLRNWDPPALCQEATAPVETFGPKMGIPLAGGERARYY